MQRIAIRFSALVLFVLASFALLNWQPPADLVAWRLSVLASQMGLWFALATALTGGRLLASRSLCRRTKSIAAAIALLAVCSYMAPLASVLRHESAWRGDLDRAFGPGRQERKLWSLSVALFGRGEPKIEFSRDSFKRAAGPPLNIDRYSAAAPGVGPVPWILVVHGGGWNSGNSEQLPELNSHLAAQGYTVFAIDYRLAPEAKWPDMKADVLGAIAFIKAHAEAWRLDRERWAILGRSAGAQIAGAVAYSLKGNERPRALISFYGPTDLTFGYEVAEDDDMLNSRGLIHNLMGAPPEAAPDAYADASMMLLASKDSCPTLMLHGRRDTLVWFKHSERLATRLRTLGVKSALLVLDWGPHGFDFFLNGPEGQVSTSAVDHFLARELPL